MTSREVILREMGLTPIWVKSASVFEAPIAELAAPVVIASERLAFEPEQSATEREAAIANLSWDELIASIANCTACKLCKTRTNTVPGIGDRRPTWMVIGEALATRELLDSLRQSGVMGGGPAPFVPKDRSRFLSKLDETIQKIRRRRTL